MSRLRALVEAGERQVGVFEDVRRVALGWRADGEQTAVHILEKERLVVLKIHSHQERGEYLPSGYTVTLNDMADSLAKGGASEGEVPNIIVPSMGSQFYQTFGGVGMLGYVGRVIRRLGEEQADMKLRGLRQQGILARLGEEVGEGYYEVGNEAFQSPRVQRFSRVVWGGELRGAEERARGAMTHGVGGTVRAHCHCPEAARMMQAIGEDQERWGRYALGVDQVRRY